MIIFVERIHEEHVSIPNHCKNLAVLYVLGVKSILFYVNILKEANGVNEDKSASRNGNPASWGYLATTLLFCQVDRHLDNCRIERMLFHHLKESQAFRDDWVITENYSLFLQS